MSNVFLWVRLKMSRSLASEHEDEHTDPTILDWPLLIHSRRRCLGVECPTGCELQNEHFHLLRMMVDWLVSVQLPSANPRQEVYPFVGIWMI